MIVYDDLEATEKIKLYDKGITVNPLFDPSPADGAAPVQSPVPLFVGLSIDKPVWVPTVFTKNRDRLLNTEISRELLAAILAHEKMAPLLSHDHFSVDGTLVEAWASFKSFRPKSSEPKKPQPPDEQHGGDENEGGIQASGADAMTETAASRSADGTDTAVGRNMERNWRGQAWSNLTHASVSDPDARPYRKAKGRPAQLCYMGHALTENRHGFELTLADGTAERRASIRLTLGVDKGYDDQGFVAELRRMCVTPARSGRRRRAPRSMGAPRVTRATR
jgi:hypothetical protein